MWFPGIDKSVERKIASCIPYQASTNSSQCEPLKMFPWLQVSADFCGPLPTGEMVLVVLDAYSKYPEVESVSSIAAKDTIPALERIFAPHGIPEVLKTDNGPPSKVTCFSQLQKRKVSHTKKFTPVARGKWPCRKFHKKPWQGPRTAYSQGKDWGRDLS